MPLPEELVAYEEFEVMCNHNYIAAHTDTGKPPWCTIWIAMVDSAAVVNYVMNTSNWFAGAKHFTVTATNVHFVPSTTSLDKQWRLDVVPIARVMTPSIVNVAPYEAARSINLGHICVASGLMAISHQEGSRSVVLSTGDDHIRLSPEAARATIQALEQFLRYVDTPKSDVVQPNTPTPRFTRRNKPR